MPVFILGVVNSRTEMFCPSCKAEYRPGIAICYDCQVALVPELPAAPGETEEDPFCAFWKGDDPRVHAELCAVLDRAGIPFKTVRREDHLFNLNWKDALQIGVPSSLFEKAEGAVKEAFGTNEEIDAVKTLAPPGLPASDESENLRDDWDPENWYPEDATLEVWSGEQSGLAEMLVASLRENHIHARLDTDNGVDKLYVLPEDEARVRKIVHEIIEAVPPE